MPVRLTGLLLSVFCLGTAEYMIAGLLPDLAQSLAVSIPAAGLLVTGYALTVVVGGPLLTLATSRLPRKSLMLALMVVFAAGNCAAALAPSFPVLLAARVVSALAHCTLFALALVLANRLVAPEKSASAVAMVAVSLNLATILGVPLGIAVAELWSWRASFWGVAALTVVGALFAAVTVPRDQARGGGAASELRVLGNRRVRQSVLITVLGTAGGYLAYTFVAPLLTEVGGFSSAAVSPLLLVFGAGSLLGSVLGGRLADRALMPSLTGLLALLVATITLFGAVVAVPALAVGALFLFGLAFFSIVPALGARVMAAAATDAPTLAVAVNIAAFNASIAFASWAGGRLLDAGLSLRETVFVGAAITAVGFVVSYRQWRGEEAASGQGDRSTLTPGRADVVPG